MKKRFESIGLLAILLISIVLVIHQKNKNSITIKTNDGKIEYTNFLKLKKMCDKQNGNACAKYALYKNTIGRGNIQEIFELYKKACDLGSGDGCYGLYQTKYDLNSDYKSETILNKACDLGSGEACSWIAHKLYYDDTTKEQSLQLYKKSCEILHYYGSCSSLEHHYKVWDKNEKLSKYYKELTNKYADEATIVKGHINKIK